MLKGNFVYCYRIEEEKVVYKTIPYSKFVVKYMSLLEKPAQIVVACTALGLPDTRPSNRLELVKIVEFWNENSVDWQKPTKFNRRNSRGLASR